MKYLIIILALTLSGCGTLRGIMQDEYTDEAEMLEAFDVEMEYWNVISPDRVAKWREEALKFYREVEEKGLTFDEDTLRNWILERLKE